MKAPLHILTCAAVMMAAAMLEASEEAIVRWAGTSANIELALCNKTDDGRDTFSVKAADGELSITGSSPSAICYAFNLYLREACNSMVTCSGEHLSLPGRWPDYNVSGESPYRLRYFLNVCTFGYTAPYWDWERWSEEIDWMAMHGVNMPLASVASEAIARRVWMKRPLPEGCG